MSKGFKRRVGLAQAILHDPDVLILDEPTDGLDPNQKHQVRELIAEMSADKAIVISTHVLEEVDAVCSRAIVIARGKKIADGTPKDLERRSGYYNSVSVHLHPDHIEGLRGALDGMDDISGVEVGNIDGALAQVTVMSREGATIVEAVNTRIRENGISVEQLYVERGRLDDVFRQITSDGGAASTILAISRRELNAYFSTPLAYVFIVIFLALAGATTFYFGGFFQRGQADLAVLLVSSLAVSVFDPRALA